MAAITDYSTLKTAIGSWMFDRSDLTTVYDDFIDNFEARINYGTDEDGPFPSKPLRVSAMVTSSDVTLSSGAGSMPANFLEVIRVTAKTDPRRKLEYASADWLDEAYPTTDSGDPSFYTILGSSLIVRPVTTSSVEVQFYRTVPALSDSNTTNWLLTASPNAYLYGSLFEASLFIGDGSRAQQMYGMMMGAVGGLIRTDKRALSGTPARRASAPAW